MDSRLGKETRDSVLDGCRVLDLADEKGDFCGKLLAGLGADVIKVEPPGGDPTRCIGPFYKAVPHPERSLHWYLYNLGKRSITLNLLTETGREIFLRLVGTADIIVETYAPGYLANLDLGYEKLKNLNSHIIMTSITPFGQEGPYSHFRGSHLITSSLGGYVYICGDPDRPPVHAGVPIGNLLVGSQAAQATMLAYYWQQLSGKGTHIDVSTQEGYLIALLPAQLAYKSHGAIALRETFGPYIPGLRWEPLYYRCKDGYIACLTTYWPGRERVRDWMAEEGMAGDLLDEKWDHIYSKGEPPTVEEKKHIDELFQVFAMKHTQAELFPEGQNRGIQLFPINTVDRLIEDPHLREKEYFINVEHPELNDGLRYQGVPFRMSRTPYSIGRRAPLIGEHNDEVYIGELGFTTCDLTALGASKVI